MTAENAGATWAKQHPVPCGQYLHTGGIEEDAHSQDTGCSEPGRQSNLSSVLFRRTDVQKIET